MDHASAPPSDSVFPESSFASLVDALGSRAAGTPGRTAYLFLADGEEEQHLLTYAALDGQARAIAAALARVCEPGDRALLLYPPGLDFVAAFFGCLYAGVIAVPAYPPRSPRTMPRLLAILADARPAVALAPAASAQRVRGWLERTPEAAALPWLATDELPSAPAGWEPAPSDGGAVAFLQYTSGSTSTPKGVMVTHGNLTHNQRVIETACGHSEESVFVSWLPLYHDLGLIGNLLQATWVGAPCVLMSPVAFLQSPVRWLRAVSRYRATTSGGPNFAYDLCVRKVPAAERERLDLSSWRVAFNGAEPVREETLSRFAEAFAPYGFSAGALYPCYGLAEATLMVSGGRPGEEPVVREFEGRRLVGCGRILPGLEATVVDGEIWVAGGSVARGYWNRPEETARAFGAHLPDGRGPFLRTGDLGVLADGELFIAGRLKDLIILRGRNHYPQDLEATAEASHPALAGGAGTAFAVDAEGEERLVIVHEVERHAAAPEEIAAAVRQAIARDHEAVAYEVVLVPPGGVPRTTSGKVQRRACRDLYLEGELRAVSRSRLEAAVAEDLEAALPGSQSWLRHTFAAAARIAPGGIDPDRPLTACGLDSLAAIEWKQAVEAATGVSLPIVELLDGMTLAEAARRVSEGTESAREAAEPEGAETGEHPLSWGQRSLWFLYRLAPESAAYNIAGAARLSGDVDAAALARAFQALVSRHPLLRATFSSLSGEPVERIAERAEAAFARLDLRGASDEEVRQRLHEEAFRPFDLETGPVLRAALLERGGEAFLVLAVHHIAADFWSMAVLARELGALLAGEEPPRPASLYTAHTRRQERLLAGPRGERLQEHWRERLSGAPTLDLPTDRPRPPVQTFRGGTTLSSPSPGRAAAVRAIAAAHGGTPFAALLAGFHALLARWSGQEDFVTGSPTAGRSAPGLEGVVGYFVNPVPLRADLSGDPAAGELVARVRATVLDALEHQDLPFALLAERLQPERDPSRPPLVETMLTLQRAPTPDLAALGAFALGLPGARLALSGLTLESVPLAPPAAQLDLSLMAAELDGGLALQLQWSSDLFDEATAERMLGHFDRLLAGMAEAPERPVWEIDLLSAAERGQLAASPAPEPLSEASIHELFEEQAARSPERVALEDEDGLEVTYAELAERANRLAHHLLAMGVTPETPVGVALDRSPERVVSFLGILEAGGAYVPLDPAYPRERLALMMEEAAVPFLVTEARLLGALPGSLPASVLLLDREREAIARRSAAPPGLWSEADGLAYVMFTSGSTGRPKAVGVPHRAVVRLVRGADYADLRPEQVFLQLAPAAFDAATLEIWGPLLNGGRLAFPPPGPLSLDALAAAIARHRVTTLWLTAGLFHEVVESRIEILRPLYQLLAGGDVLSPEAVNRVLAELPGCTLINGYGPTENTTFTACHTVREPVPPGGSVPIGRPIAHTRVEVLDARLRPVPPGVPGELFAGGHGLARGYLGRPDRTAERFVPDPFHPGERLYRTGDRVRLRPDGALEFLGRLDGQVKIRGFRVEPGEVEAALAAHEAVTAAAVVAREGASSGKSLAAFVALSGPADLRSWLEDRVPAYMVPSPITVLPSLPLDTHGKVDRRALARLAGPEDGEGGYVPPRTPTEELLAGIWADLLGAGRVGAEDDFFALGGHSLLALRLAARLAGTFGAEVPLALVFESPTVAALAAAVDRARGAAAEAGPVVPVSRAAALPLSFAQERLWFLDRLAPGLPLYSLPVALRLEGPLDAAALSRALGEIARRHEALRTVFPEVEGRPVQEVRPEGLALARIDLSALPAPAREEEARRRAVSEARRPFDLARGPLARATLLRIGEGEHRLVLNLHHIVADGWSIGVFARELAALYGAFSRGLPSPLPELPVQYADYAAWQREKLDGEALAAELSWWREALAGAPAALDLPTDRPRPAVQSFRGTAEPVDLADGPELAALARRAGATRFMTLFSGLAALLHRYTGQTDLVLGSVFAGRSRPEVQGLIGFFVNALPLRVDLAGDPGFAGLLARVRKAALGAYAHQDLPLERLVQEVQRERDLSRSPLFQAVFVLQDEGIEALRLPGVETAPEPLHTGTAKFDLTLSLAASGGRLRGDLELAADLFDPATGRRLLAHLGNLLAAAAAEPDRPVSQLAILSEAERSHLLTAWNPAGEAQPDPVPLHRRFAAEAARRPQAPAVTCGEVTWTYGELAQRANRIARRLRRLGVGPEERVGLRMERSAEAVAGLLGILLAGGAYVPLDPETPAERLAFTLEDAGCRVLVSEESLEAIDRESPEDPGVEVPAEAAAYVIYTSGSTGRPKGVVVTHANAARLFDATRRQVDFGPGDVTPLFHSLAFDFSVWELWGALAHGGRLVVVPTETARSAEALLPLLARERVTVLNQTPSAFRQLVQAEDGTADLALRLVIFGGEALEPASLAPWFARRGDAAPRLVNMYGITETTVHVTWRPLKAADARSVLGEPIADLRVHLLDRHLEPVPLLVAGEIHVGGAGLARGYLGRPELTAERFVPDPFGPPGARLYRSGDLARRLPDGDLEYLGRIDTQVKIRGFRIELGEIEAALASHPEVREAVVVVREAAHGDRRLAAYVVPAGDGVSVPELRSHLGERLPAYMVPAAFVEMERLPLTPNGKLDRKALPEPEAPARQGFIAPRTPAEERVAGVWADLLGVDPVGAEDDFFELGGHSLLAAQAVARLRSALGVDLPVRALFESPTVAGLAEAVEAARRAGTPALTPIRARDRREAPPLSFAQERLWFLDRLEPGSPVYVIPVAFRLRGALSAGALATALGGIVRRHDVLRATFTAREGQALQRIVPSLAVPLPVIDLSGLPAPAREAEAARRAEAEARRPFDLEAGPLLRASLVRLGAGDHVLLLSLHHIAADGGSLEVLLRELSVLYAASPLPALPVQYADYAAWQREGAAAGTLDAQLAWWRERLARVPEALDLPTDRPRPAMQTFRGAAEPVEMGPELVRALRGLARREGATLFMTLLAGLASLLHRSSGQDALAIGTPVAHRPADASGLIGLFVNTLPLPADFAGDPPFSALLRALRDTALAAFERQDVPFERLVEELAPRRDLARSPLFQVLFVLRDGPSPLPDLPGVEAREVPLHNGTAKFELTLSLAGSGDGLAGGLEVNADLFDAATARLLAGRLARLLAAAAASPETRVGDLPLLDRDEERQVLFDWNATASPFPRHLGLHELFEEQAARTPSAIALVAGEERLTYRELDRRAGRLARKLRALGVGPEVLVGVFATRNADLIAALLAVLKAGGAYVPLDPAYPAERLAFLLADSAAPVLLAEERLTPRLPPYGGRVVTLGGPEEADGDAEAERGFVHPEQTAYAIYTSGSTGAPKGVLIRHGSAVARISWAASAYSREALSGVLASTSVCFDLSVFEIFAPLSAGGTVILADDALALPELPAAAEVTLVNTVPSAIAELARAGAVPPSVRVVNLAGEPLRRELVRRLYGLPGVEEVHNLYGPSEDTTYSTGARALEDDGREPTIGRPLPNTRVHLLGPDLRPAPVSVPGELWIGGQGLARGYLRRPDLTAERFRPNPWGEPGSRLYKTGDLARFRPDGEIEFLGRLDHQVKVRGFRIEPGEIEAALLAHPAVREAAVVTRDEAGGGKSLIACVVPAVPELRRFLAARLPAHMVPALFVPLAEVPRTPNGKVDRKELSRLAASALRPETAEYVPPQNAVEELLAPLWAEVLGVERVGSHDDFFALGGSSLLGMRLIAKVQELFGVALPVRSLFHATTLAAMAERIAQGIAEQAGDDLLESLLAPAEEVPHG